MPSALERTQRQNNEEKDRGIQADADGGRGGDRPADLVRRAGAGGRGTRRLAPARAVRRNDRRDHRQGDADRRAVGAGDRAGRGDRRDQRQAGDRDRRRAEQLCQSADLADRRGDHDLARADQDWPGRAHRLWLHHTLRQAHDRHRLRAGRGRPDDRAGHAEQHRAWRRDHPSDHARHRRQLRFRPGQGHPGAYRPLPGAGQLPRQSDHLGDVHHRHRAEPADRQAGRRRHRRAGAVELGHLGAGDAAAGAGGAGADAAGDLPDVPAGDQEHAGRGALRARQAARTGADEPRREDPARCVRAAALPVGQRAGAAHRSELGRSIRRPRLSSAWACCCSAACWPGTTC